MNWKRIASGSLLAGLVVLAVDFFVNDFILRRAWQDLVQTGHILGPRPYAYVLILIQDFAIGFILMWLYALARPRLGPGPQTALVMGTLAWFLLSVPSSLCLWLWCPFPAQIPAAELLGGLMECWAGIYVAGWQYIEKAP